MVKESKSAEKDNVKDRLYNYPREVNLPPPPSQDLYHLPPMGQSKKGQNDDEGKHRERMNNSKMNNGKITNKRMNYGQQKK